MYEFQAWVDKSFRDVSFKDSFLKYFSNIKPENIEDTYFLSNESQGIDVTFTEDLVVKSIHLHSGKYPGYNEFKEDLPLDLKFTYSRATVKKIVKLSPSISGGGFNNPVIGIVNKWDKYLFDSYSIHLQYSKDEEYIELITIGSLRFEEEALPE